MSAARAGARVVAVLAVVAALFVGTSAAAVAAPTQATSTAGASVLASSQCAQLTSENLRSGSNPCGGQAFGGTAVLVVLATLATVGALVLSSRRGQWPDAEELGAPPPPVFHQPPPTPTAPPPAPPVIDVDLPGPLPLVLARTRVPTDARGGLFGPGWCSTLDQRLELHPHGIRYLTADGRALDYPLPPSAPAPPVLPRDGRPWPLTATPDGTYRIDAPDHGWTRHFTPGRTHPALRLLSALTDRDGNRITVHHRDDVPVAVEHSDGRRVAIDTTATASGLRITALRRSDGTDAAATSDTVLRRYTYDDQGRLIGASDADGAPAPL